MLRLPHTWERALLSSAAMITFFGTVAMASAAASFDPGLLRRHIEWAVIGIAAYLIVSRSNHRRWTDIAMIAYVASLAVLAILPIAGTMRLGATRWLSLFGFSFQPSEIAKLSTILVLSRYFSGQPGRLSKKSFWISLAIAAVPALLIFFQPDLGSASVICAIWAIMVYTAGAPRKTLLFFAAGLISTAPIGWHFLKSYQRDRLLAFINPHSDPLGAGYTIIQSTIAIGSGRYFGRGWFSGTQNQLNFLPERHSDFIYSVIGEEWGFAGGFAMVVLFGVLLYRIIQIAIETSDPQGKLLAAGVFSWIGYQAFVNMGMVTGLLPVVGVPLPLVSYGGSSMISVWIALGLTASAYRSSRN